VLVGVLVAVLGGVIADVRGGRRRGGLRDLERFGYGCSDCRGDGRHDRRARGYDYAAAVLGLAYFLIEGFSPAYLRQADARYAIASADGTQAPVSKLSMRGQ